jgi:hypothetical protein
MPKNLILAVDFDDTLVNNTIIEEVAAEYNMHKNPDEYDLSDYPVFIRKIIFSIFNDKDRAEMTKFKPVPGVRKKIKELVKFGFKIAVVTSRVNSEIDRVYIKNLFPLVSDVIFTGINNTKESIIKKLNPVAFIDDRIVDEYLSLDCKVLMISNKKTRYNFKYRNKVKWFKKFSDIKLEDILN